MSNVTMWKYKTVSRDEFETRKEFVEQIMLRLGAEPTKYGNSIPASRTIYKYKHEYYRVDEILIWDKPYLVIEWTDRLDFITDGIDIMEDIAPFPYDLSDEQITLEITSALQPTAKNACEEYHTHRIAILAEVLYNLGFEFKRHNLIKLNRKKYRKECLRTISIMQYILQWMLKGRIEEKEAIPIVRTLDAYQHPRLSDYQARFLEAHAESDYSAEYHRLLSDMADTLQSCADVISNQHSAEYMKVWKTMCAIHNAPRAFLSVANRMHCSLEQARAWAGLESSIS